MVQSFSMVLGASNLPDLKNRFFIFCTGENDTVSNISTSRLAARMSIAWCYCLV